MHGGGLWRLATSACWFLIAAFPRWGLASENATTGEAHEVAVRFASGASAVLGFTVLPDGSVSFTVIQPSLTQGWLGIGVASPSALDAGESLMQGGGAVIFRPSALSDPVVAEYLLNGPSSVTVFSSTSASTDAGACLQNNCYNEIAKCYSIPQCKVSLHCVQGQLILNSTLDTSNATLHRFSACSYNLSSQTDSAENQALGALLAVSSCFAFNCMPSIRASLQSPGIASVYSAQSASGGSKLSFVSKAGTIAGVPLSLMPGRPTPIMLSYNAELSSFSHTVDQTAVISLGLADGGVIPISGVPSWVISHSVMASLALGVLLPIVEVMRTLALPGATVLLLLAVVLAATGLVVASENIIATRSWDIHSKLGIVPMILSLGIFPLVACTSLRPLQLDSNSSGTQHTWSVMAAAVEALLMFAVSALATAVAFIGVANLFSSRLVDPSSSASLMVLPILCAASLAISVVVHILVFAKRRCRQRHDPGQQKSIVRTLPPRNGMGQTSELTLTSTNPSFTGHDALLRVPIFLAFSNVSYAISAPGKQGDSNEISKKIILKSCSGVCAPKTLTAIMGPSGAGKTTLLDVLSGRSKLPAMDGSQITINGSRPSAIESLGKHVGFVMQSDLHFPYLTVFETLEFAAHMTCDPEMSNEVKYAVIMRVIAILALNHVIDSKVGSISVRGLSGGERRRVTIGIQLIKSPSLLFLDEPTSGLDSHTAYKIIFALRQLANEGCTILCTVHQPSTSIFECFDQILLLSAGKTVFSGPRNEALRFFAGAGRPVPSNWNPTEWYIMVIDANRRDDDDYYAEKERSRNKDTLQVGRTHSLPNNIKLDASVLRVMSHRDTPSDLASLRDALVEFYQSYNPKKAGDARAIDELVQYTLDHGLEALNAKLFTKYSAKMTLSFTNRQPATAQEIDKMVETFALSTVSKANVAFALKAEELTGGIRAFKGESDSRVTLARQIFLLIRRIALVTVRDPSILLFQAVQNLGLGILLGILFVNMTVIQARAVVAANLMALVLGLISFVVTSSGAAVAFKDKQIFEREQADNMYSPMAHFLARTLSTLPINTSIALPLIVPAYWIIGLRSDGLSFVFFVLVSIGVMFVFDSVLYVATLVARTLDVAYGLGNFHQAMAVLFCGVFIPYYVMPSVVSWVYFIDPFSYAFAAVTLNQFLAGPDEWFLSAAGIVYRSRWGNLAVLFAMGIFWRGLGFFILAAKYHRFAWFNQKVGNSAKELTEADKVDVVEHRRESV